jgi:starch synthase (maltosyl-transferring)
MLGGNYGIYNGFELCEAAAVPGKEEYLNSEKYQIRAWDWDRPGHIRDDIRLVNRLRHEHPALQSFADVTFYNAWNDNILYFGKATPGKDNFVLCAVNLDPHSGQGANFEVPLWEFGLPDEAAIGVANLITGERFTWQGKIQNIWLDPAEKPYAIWLLNPPGANV